MGCSILGEAEAKRGGTQCQGLVNLGLGSVRAGGPGPLAVQLCRFGDGVGIAVGVAEGEHGGHPGPAEDLVGIDTCG
jgi:hypothetical protein